ncbi:unnamed protein product [Oppiella nova]|uniref:Orn/DAP/Arg decarboxylase 2 N-terminal domain-containing protein n=1 Tax=Oppiella nova TaxID=334625 RepID=A0A7R9MGX3_9ACAR|nr:unnamed protein product [Oppiella nova]CAG2176184.1 unnamed protein product [Oppiella nova]
MTSTLTAHIVDPYLPETPIANVIRDVITGNERAGRLEEAFYVVDVENIIEKYRKLLKYMPRMKQHYAIKGNPSPIVLEILAGMGISFDCASRGEIETILKLGVSPNRIIFANPVKARSHITFAAEVGVTKMTFDSEYELYKIQRMYPGADMVLRILVSDKSVKYPLAKKLGVNIIGTSFHVGSLCQSGKAYARAIRDSRYVFDLGNELGFNMHLLDIGGGFSGTTTSLNKTSIDMAQTVSKALEYYFPVFNQTTDFTVISEFGRYYVDTAYTLADVIEGKKRVILDDVKSNIRNEMMYYIMDGVHQSFREVLVKNDFHDPIPLDPHNPNEPLYNTTLWGPTCDSVDAVRKGFWLPELSIGEWIYFDTMGAYTVAEGGEFNGFKVPRQLFFVSERARQTINAMNNRDMIFAILATGAIPTEELVDVDLHQSRTPFASCSLPLQFPFI